MKVFQLIIFLAISTLCTAQNDPVESSVISKLPINDSLYNASFEKLKKLLIAKIHTQGYQENKKLITAFREKLRENSGLFPSGIGQQPSVLAWVKINLEKTKFKSYEEAVTDYDAILKASQAEDVKNPDYLNYSVTAVLNYGPQILVDVVLEVMMEYPDKF